MAGGSIHGGEEGIRTLDTLMRYTRFPIVRARPTTRLLHVCSRKYISYSLVSLDIIIHRTYKVKEYFFVFCKTYTRRPQYMRSIA